MWVITPIYPIYNRRNNPLILTIDPNFQWDIQVGFQTDTLFFGSEFSHLMGMFQGVCVEFSLETLSLLSPKNLVNLL